jgi:Domain of unknown function (DUF4402)
MKTLRHVLTIAVLALTLPARSVEPLPDGPRQPAVAGFTVSARVVSGLGLSKTADLEMGAVTPGETAGSITVSPDETARLASGGVSTAASNYGAARFAVSGAAADVTRLRVSLPDRVILSGGSGGGRLTAHAFTGRLVGGGAGLELVVGATVDVGASQPAGRYTGTFTVTVNES